MVRRVEEELGECGWILRPFLHRESIGAVAALREHWTAKPQRDNSKGERKPDSSSTGHTELRLRVSGLMFQGSRLRRFGVHGPHSTEAKPAAPRV